MAYDYYKEVDEDIKYYLTTNYSEITGFDNEDDFIEAVEEELYENDDITGCRFGYDFSRSNQLCRNSKEAILDNIELFNTILRDYEYDYETLYDKLFEDQDWDYFDSIIREAIVSEDTGGIVDALLQSNDIEFIPNDEDIEDVDIESEEEDYDEGFDEEESEF